MNSISSDKNRRAGALLPAGLFLVLTPYCALGQPGPVEVSPNIECLEHLEVPVYPPLARAGRFPGTMLVKVLLSDHATLQSIEINLQEKVAGRDKFFKDSVERAIANSRFSKACGGKIITLVFQLRASNDEARSLSRRNLFIIRSGAVLVNPQVPQVNFSLRNPRTPNGGRDSTVTATSAAVNQRRMTLAGDENATYR